PWIFPEPGGDDLDEKPFAVKNPLDLSNALDGAGPVEIRWYDIVVVKLHGVEAQFFVGLELARVFHLPANGWPEGVGTRADVPGAKGKTIFGLGSGSRVSRAHERSISSLWLARRRGKGSRCCVQDRLELH